MASEVEQLMVVFYRRQLVKAFKPEDQYATHALLLIAKNLEEINASLATMLIKH